jgi:hypothetical protein
MAEVDIDQRFDERTIAQLAVAARLRPTADLVKFGESVRTAARLYLVEQARDPRRVRRELSDLYRVADRVMAGKLEPNTLETALAELSARARQLLEDRALVLARLPLGHLPRPRLPSAPDQLMTLLRYGGRMQPGRLRQGGKLSRPVFVPLLWAPIVGSGRPRNEAARELVLWLSIAFLEAGGRPPPRMADSRKLGPFARLVRGCLDRLDARWVDAGEVISAMGRLRRDGPHG